MLKKYFSAGLLLWMPLAVTLWVLETIIRWSDSLLALLPPAFQPDELLGFRFPGIGLILAAALIFVTGILVANFIGQFFVRVWEGILEKIPFVTSIYSGVKQILQTLLSDRTKSFQETVLIEFPHPGLWTYGFIVGTPSKSTSDDIGSEDLVSVFVPTAPNPTSGYVVMVEKKRLKKTTVKVDEAFKFHISLGVMSPGESSTTASVKESARSQSL